MKTDSFLTNLLGLTADLYGMIVTELRVRRHCRSPLDEAWRIAAEVWGEADSLVTSGLGYTDDDDAITPYLYLHGLIRHHPEAGGVLLQGTKNSCAMVAAYSFFGLVVLGDDSLLAEASTHLSNRAEAIPIQAACFGSEEALSCLPGYFGISPERA